MEVQANSQEQQVADKITWQKHVSDWKKKGITASQYCRENGLRIHQFKYWQYRYAPQTRNSKKTPIVASTSTPFIPVKIVQPIMNYPTCVVYIGTKSRIEIQALNDDAWLKQLIHYLAEV